MRWILTLYVLCSIASLCLTSGTEQKDEVTSVGNGGESEVLSSLLPDSQDSTYFLAFPVDEVNTNNDQQEIVQAAGTESTKSPPLADNEDNKDEIMTIVLDAGKDKVSKNDVIPIQNLQPKQEMKFFSPPPPPPPPPFPLFPFPFKTKPERKLGFPPFGRFRPKFLPPVRNLLQSFRREESPFKLNPMDIFGAASFLKKILSTKLRILTDKYQPNIEEKIASVASPLLFLKESITPPSIFLPFPEPSFPGPLSQAFSGPLSHPFSGPLSHPFSGPLSHPFSGPLSHPLLLSSLLPPPPHLLHLCHSIHLSSCHHHLPIHFFIPPTPFVPLPPYHPLHSLPPSPMFNPAPYYHLPPPPFMYNSPPPFPLPHPLTEPATVTPDHPQEVHPMQKPSDDEFVFVPSETGMPQTSKSEEPEYLFLYPNQPEGLKPIPPRPKSLLDLLRPKSNRVQHVIQQTRIITQFKPDMLNQPELLNYHKPIMRIIDN
ncbi:uncharacterized protein [Centruroides vittatus]|uniref:uncharacterized protein isoform X1 n=1 Tax=Centruroides vittatus TaxID=120091 RepID=UPI00350F70AC